ncbi:hypothetical protein CTI12_AA367570 [Artemisia annua]|uniref:Uncharacterized protein n=1 Tax=Artemisia annua TaxID=35608 RepID=A0A2U1MLA1_ARTAN|nr:hypothetical protein CTI12_AA367570 [Artemisia annua]
MVKLFGKRIEPRSRRVLKWTYAYGYYLPTYEEAKKELFEDLRGQAEIALEKNASERLHYCAEKEVSTYIETHEEAATSVHILTEKLINLTDTARKFFKNLLRALENDLSEVDDYDLSYQWERSQAVILSKDGVLEDIPDCKHARHHTCEEKKHSKTSDYVSPEQFHTEHIETGLSRPKDRHPIVSIDLGSSVFYVTRAKYEKRDEGYNVETTPDFYMFILNVVRFKASRF